MKKAFFQTSQITLYQGSCLDVLRQLPSESVDCVVTSPPYYGLRDYGVNGQIGSEPTLQDYISTMVEVFAECHRLLKPTGTAWLNLGDSYASSGVAGAISQKSKLQSGKGVNPKNKNVAMGRGPTPDGMKPKDLMLVPHRVAIALQDWGWWVRNDNVWRKPNPMPESVSDRCTRSHEYVFQLAKSEQYFYDADAIKEDSEGDGRKRGKGGADAWANGVPGQSPHRGLLLIPDKCEFRNKRSVWTIATKPYPEAHFAVFPPEIPRICISAGCPADGVVLDPFAGSGTTLEVARDLGRKAIGIELNPDYCKLIEKRCRQLTIFGIDAIA